jgi:hypothetical protein
MAAPKQNNEGRRPDIPSAGPHAKPELMNPEATPGAGTLPPIGEDDENMQPTS